MKVIIFLFSLAMGLAASHSVQAEPKNHNNWFIEGRYQASVYEARAGTIRTPIHLAPLVLKSRRQALTLGTN
jgi:hypothetical protein